MKLLHLVPLGVLIAACSAQDLPTSSPSAQFSAFPDRLFKTFERSCDGPGETFLKIDANSFECREFLPPDTTAFLILSYDGSPEDLPQSIMRMTSTKTSGGYRVDAQLFFQVPQKSGAPVEVPVESKTLDKALGALYQAMGGSPT